MSTTSTGRDAEAHVAEYLKSKGHTIVDLNWRTRWCEIDIVSQDKKCVYFTEVKYRSSSDWGSGFDYITKKKQQQMRFAAEFWIAQNKWKKESVILGAEVDADQKITIIEIS